MLSHEQLRKKFPNLDWAALDQYLYFVSQNDRTHYFSKTLDEHNIAVQRYLKQKEEGAAAGKP